MTRAPLLLAVVLWAACDVRDVDVFGGPMGADVGTPRRSCTNNQECGPHGVCDKLSCGAALGRCEPRQTFCPADQHVVCGCNGVTYWNDCLRLANGEMSKIEGDCPTPAVCGGAAATACPDPAASCARLLASDVMCGGDDEGVCWVLPATCPAPAPAGGGAWIACGMSSCSDVCTAIRSTLPHRRATVCP